ncbi:MAG: helix-turn-helix domain-containing protein [Acidimicrobiia bacterium]
MTLRDEELLTTGQAARVLGSSRQHVVDLCSRGLLPHTSTGSHRRVRRSDLERLAASEPSRELTRDQRRSLWLHRAIAGRIAEDPERHLRTARANLKVMLTAHPRGQAAAQLAIWQRLLDGPVEAVLDVLCMSSPQAADLRQNTPFAGVLTDAERQAVLAAFRSTTRRGGYRR